MSDSMRDLKRSWPGGLPRQWFRSLRVRLHLWYAALLIAVVGTFGTILYHRAAQEKSRQIDAQIEGAMRVLDAELRAFPPHDLGLVPPDFLEKKRKPPPPGRKKREDFLAELDLPHDFAERRGYFAVWQADGALVKEMGFGGDVQPATDPPAEPLAGKPFFVSEGPYREAWMAGPLGSKILAGRSVVEDFNELHAFGLSILGVGLGAIALGIGGGWWIAGRMVRPIEKMSAAAAAISGDNLSQRIDVKSIDTELSGLGDVLNAMFARLEAAFDRQQQFTADASHELRTPLSIIRSQVELALSKPRTPDEYRQTLDTCLRAAQRMSNLAQGLLALARVDAGKSLSWQNVSFHEVVADCVAQLRTLADAKQIRMTADLSPIVIVGNSQRLGQVVLNLVNNAIAFNKIGGEIDVRLTAAGGIAQLTVRDTGVGIPAADCSKIFQRFFRVDKSRSRAVGGTGLGLAICKTFVEAHQGTIDFTTEEGVGTTFRVRLPMQPPNLSITRRI